MTKLTRIIRWYLRVFFTHRIKSNLKERNIISFSQNDFKKKRSVPYEEKNKNKKVKVNNIPI